jgi:adenylate cyclase
MPAATLLLLDRNVVGLVKDFAGAAFVIIELINNITEPLRLPVWTLTLVIVLLAIGFPVVITFSWIYDIHPQEGIVKTEPAVRDKTGAIHSGKTLDKSIAVLSFDNLSSDQENTYFIDGMMCCNSL